MQVFFCTTCDAGLVFGRRRCRHCGVRLPAGGGARYASPRSPSLRFARLGGFFASQASLSLITLLLLLGLGIALAPAGWRYVLMEAREAGAPRLAAVATTGESVTGAVAGAEAGAGCRP